MNLDNPSHHFSKNYKRKRNNHSSDCTCHDCYTYKLQTENRVKRFTNISSFDLIPTSCNCKYLDSKTHSLCSNNCVCFSIIDHQCSEICGCKGICSNGKSITDDLFFKVWRNIYLRSRITGDRMLEDFKRKNQFKKDLIESLNKCNIKYNERDIDIYASYYGGNSRPEVNLEYTLEKYFEIERKNREIQFKNQFKLFLDKNNFSKFFIYFRGSKNSDLIKSYTNTILPEDQLKLAKLEDLIIEEFNSIVTICETLQSLFQQECLEFNLNYKCVVDFIKSGSVNVDEIILTIRKYNEGVKRSKIYKALNDLCIRPNFIEQINRYINTFKKEEMILNNVWSFDQIVYAEMEFRYINQEKEKRTKSIVDYFNANNLIFRANSENIIKFINNIPPMILPTTTTPTILSIPTATTTFSINTNSYIEDLTIEKAIRSENQSIGFLKNELFKLFKEEGLKFDDKSPNVIDFIKESSFDHVDSNNNLVKKLIELEIENQKQIKSYEVMVMLNKHGIEDSVFKNYKSDYVNTFKEKEIIDKNVVSLQELLQMELAAQSKYKTIIYKLNKKGIKIRRGLRESTLVKTYLENSVCRGNENTTISKVNNVPTLQHIVQIEVNFRNRKKELKSKLKEIGLLRKNSLYYRNPGTVFSINFNYGVDDTEIIDYLNSTGKLTIDQIIRNEIFRWIKDTSDNGKRFRKNYIINRLIDYEYDESEFIDNYQTNSFIAGCTISENLWSLEKIVKNHLKSTREYFENLSSSEESEESYYDSDEFW